MAHTRNSSFELLRLMLMLMIVIHHCIVHGLNLISLGGTEDLFIPRDWMLGASVANAFCICAVNCFVLISGFWGIKTSRNKIIFLVFALAFYTILFTVIPEVFRGHQQRAISHLFMLSSGLYWFITDYIFLMILAPLINAGINQLTDNQRFLSVGGLLLISCYFGFFQGHSANINGYTLLQFITLYCLGREIRHRNIFVNRKTGILVYVLSSLVCGLSMWWLWNTGHSRLAWQMTYYNNPLIVLAAVALILVFKDIHIESKYINNWAKSAMGIYLSTSSFVVSIATYRTVRSLAEYSSGLRGGVYC